MRLYIIGNGFDIRHNLPTGYKHFKIYVQKNDRDLFNAIESYLPVGDLWNELESALGDIDYEQVLDENSMFLASPGSDEWTDASNHDFQYEVEQTTELLSERLKEKFADWIKSIDLTPALKPSEFIPPIPTESLYFTFNYTNTLQQIYHIKDINIKHIHGNCLHDDFLELGHAFTPAGPINKGAGPDQDIRIAEAYSYIDRYFGATFKPVNEIISDESDYFLSLRNVNEVHVYGHSLSEVDGEYFKKISQSILPDAKWLVALYSNEKKCGNLENYGIDARNIKSILYENI
ncbi:bacteriophage abortive infection AbiH family protein [Enterobacter sp. 229I2]|uniref:bacteriophage abortive infection AbiH family protein n=1 Tax=Enterobacter sp. 229I2 TaxID=3077760 RepID=UPI002A80807C|nr:bacteriophage abortive infection AbiH family protein [Enterobacter sp. 229I2]